MMVGSLLSQKTVLITGAASGIGAAAAEVFAEHGAAVVLADIDVEKGREVSEAVADKGGRSLFVPTDVTSAQDVAAAVTAAVAKFGRLDCAFNNAGIHGEIAPLHESSHENWGRVLRVNLTGVWLCMKYEIAQMLAQGGGAIVNTASAAGLVGIAVPTSAYVAAKHGVVGLTRTAAVEYARNGLRINAICPGVVLTPMTEQAIQSGTATEDFLTTMQPVKRLAAPSEIAEAAAWLCSDASSFTTGLAMAVDGGWTAQ